MRPMVVEPENRLSIQLFGHLRVSVDGKPIQRIRLARSKQILAFLALHYDRAGFTRVWFSAMFWPDITPESARGSLRSCLHEIRKALGSQEYRIPDASNVYLDLTDAELDLRIFDKAVLDGRISSLKSAVALYHGPLLEGLDKEELSEDVLDVIRKERKERRQQYLTALKLLIEAARNNEEYDEAIGLLDKAIAEEPDNEQLYWQKMEALCTLNQPALALRTYGELIDADRLVVSRDIHAFAERIRRGECSTDLRVMIETETEAGHILTASILHSLANFVNAMGPVIISRFGHSDNTHVQVESPDVFFLRKRALGDNQSLLAEGTHRIEVSNIKSVKIEGFRAVTPEDPANCILYIFFKQALVGNDYIPGQGMVRNPFTNIAIYVPSADYGDHIKKLLEQAAGLA
jgi:DNA-binding SARP family transcriptional activator